MAAAYRLTATDTVIRAEDGACIPNDPYNRDRAEYQTWLDRGGAPDPYVPPAAPSSFLARDLVDQLTADDLLAIESAVSGNVALRLLWTRLSARGEKPVETSSAAFAQGWAGLSAALGPTRAAAIATALGFGN
jgi:hypothetical protein